MNRYTVALERARSADRPLLDLTVSNPTNCGFVFDRSPISQTLSQAEMESYSPQPRGLFEARAAIADYYAALPRQPIVDPESLFVVSGTSEAYAHIFRLLCNASEEVLIAAPGYPLLELLADICDVRLVRFHLLYDHGWQIDLHDLESKISSATRAAVVVHPNNPTGSYVKSTEREQLNRICTTHSLALIVDEVFIDYALEGNPQPTFAGNDEALTFVVSGLSKIAALPQMKIAWINVAGPRKERDEAIRRLELISDTFLSTSVPMQRALPQLLGSRQQMQRQLKQRLRQNLNELDRQLKNQSSCVRLLIEGGWYAVLRVPATGSDEEIAINLIDEQATVVEPGHFFDFPTDGYLVLSLLTPESVFAEGVKRILNRF